jgi:hypothetical protein
MSKHVLSLEIPDTMNKCIFRVVDTSVYATGIPITCPLLQITVPGFNTPVNFAPPQIEPGFNANMTACDLEIQSYECGTQFYDVPDGIYIVKHSVEPKDYVYVEYNHLRVTCALNKIKAIYCDLQLGACDPPASKKDKLNQIRLIEQYIKAAKAYVEDCHDPKRGMELYKYAVSLLDKMTCSTGCKTC